MLRLESEIREAATKRIEKLWRFGNVGRSTHSTSGEGVRILPFLVGIVVMRRVDAHRC